MKGMELRLRRVAARVKANQVAAAMDVSPARVSQIEALAVVTPEAAGRYLEALAQCIASTKDGDDVSESREAIA